MPTYSAAVSRVCRKHAPRTAHSAHGDQVVQPGVRAGARALGAREVGHWEGQGSAHAHGGAPCSGGAQAVPASGRPDDSIIDSIIGSRARPLHVTDKLIELTKRPQG